MKIVPPMSADVCRDGDPRKFLRAWYLYDFGSSAYVSVVILTIYAPYFKQVVVGGPEGTRLWGFAIGISMIIVSIIAPVIGALSDRRATRKPYLIFFTAMSCIFMGTLFFVQKGDVVIGVVFFVLAEIAYQSGQVFYNSLLPEVAAPNDRARVSGTGWAIGTFGGIVGLALVLPMVMMFNGDLVIRLAFVVTALFFAAFSLPLLIGLHDGNIMRSTEKLSASLRAAVAQVMSTITRVRRHGNFVKFLIAFAFFNEGVMISLSFASIIAAVLFSFEQDELIVLLICVQFSNVVGAWTFGWLGGKIGVKNSLLLAVLAMSIVIGWLYYNQSSILIYVIAVLAGFTISGIQVLSRTMVANLCPLGQAAEFFGIFTIAGRSSSFIGPAVYGWIAAEIALGHMALGMEATAAEQFGHRTAILSILGFLVVGAILLLLVREASNESAREPT